MSFKYNVCRIFSINWLSEFLFEFNPQLERVSIWDNTANVIIEVVEAKTACWALGSLTVPKTAG